MNAIETENRFKEPSSIFELWLFSYGSYESISFNSTINRKVGCSMYPCVTDSLGVTILRIKKNINGKQLQPFSHRVISIKR